MQRNNIYPSLESCLKGHRAEILHLWKESLGSREHFLLFRIRENVEQTLDALFAEMICILGGKNVVMPELTSNQMLLSAPRNEVLVLRVGEEVFVRVLRKYLATVTHEEWLSVRWMISHIFHEALRDNAITACDLCRWKLNEDLAIREKLLDEIAVKQ